MGEIKTVTFNYTGEVQTWVVPNGVRQVTIDCYGAEGGTFRSPSINENKPYYGGKGGRAKATFNVSPGQVLYIYVGERGRDSYYNTKNQSDLRAWNGGGLPKYDWNFRNPDIGYTYQTYSGGGGGASDVRVGGQDLNNRIIVAGGGGGGGKRNVGGAGGGLTGGNGGGGHIAGKGGTQTAGGAGGYTSDYSYSGQAGSFGQGGDVVTIAEPGGGGGGWYGGGSGCYGGGNYQDGGGGGGSGYIAPGATNTLFETGVRSGHGLVIITYEIISPIYVRVNGQVRESASVHVRVNGQLREVDRIWTRVNGQLREV